MTAWSAFQDELAAWRDAGLQVTLWWRDDDAAGDVPALDPLLTLSRDAGVPVALAVVPAHATADLAARLEPVATATVLQHGYAHRNHAEPPAKKCEFGPERPAQITVAELAMGWAAIERLFGAKAIPVFVPPWNRLAPYLVPMLPEMKFIGLSTFGPCFKESLFPGFRQVNTHVDIVDWKGSRGFVGEEAALAGLTGELSARRSGHSKQGEPVGFLTHHLDHEADAWRFVARLFDVCAAHDHVRWRDAASLFAGAA